jgi:leucyl aminopeptidase
MKINTLSNLEGFTGTILIPVFETYQKSLVPIEFHGVSVHSKVFFGKKDTNYLVEKYDSTHLFIGLGKTTTYASLKTIFRRIASNYKEIFGNNVALVVPELFAKEEIEAAVSGLQLGTYDLGHFKKEKLLHPFLKADFELKLISKKEFDKPSTIGLKIANAQLETMRLVDLPPNIVTPQYLANWAKESGDKYGFEVSVLGFEAAEKAGLGAFLSVGKGSQNEPQFLIMNYTPENISPKTKHIGLVGKGITFDTGGLNIKTAGMLDMKCDMAGGAAVFGAMQLIADLKLDTRVTAIVPCAENAVDAKSFLPSDVIQSYSGHSIEIIDTDAEGRLVLADGLSYLIKNFKPEYIIDIATLTGSAVGTFGHECAALFTNNDGISKKLQESGDAIGERLWQLPLWDCYKQDIESAIADVKNYSGKPVAGAISAAKFLEFFTDNHQAWAHLDIAGVAFGDNEFAKSKHASAFGVHLLTKFIATI